MLKHYFKIALRNMGKRKIFSAINILGLAAGIAFTLLIAAYVWSELGINKKLKNSKNQYFLTSQWNDPAQGLQITTLGPLAKRLKEDYPNLVSNYYRWDGITSVISKGEKHLRENIQLGDSTFLSMYGFSLLQGDVHTALNEPFSVVITQEMALKYFGKTNIVGETIDIQSFSGGNHAFTVTGVLNKIPENSVVHLDDANDNTFFIPTNTYTYFQRTDFESWQNIYVPSYVELKDGITAADLKKPIAQLIQQNAPEGIRENIVVQPVALTNYYLQKNNGLVKRMLYTLSFVGLFILIMAIINFINISISSSTARMKEIGVRKVLGSLRKQIIIQFLTESTLLVLLATVLAIAIYPFVQPYFEQMVGKAIPGLSAFPLYFIFIPAILILLVGFLAGLYPAFVLSSMQSVDSLKGKLKAVGEKVWLRKSLAGFQFCVAAIVIIAAFIVSQQVSYFFSQGLGYNKEYVVSSQVPRDWTPVGVRRMEAVRNEFSVMPQISNATLSYEIPNGNNGGQSPIYKAGDDSTHTVNVQLLTTDEHFAETYQIPMKSGNFLSTAGGFDSSKIVINAKTAHALGWNEREAIGQQIKFAGGSAVFTIKGVTSDFHFGSMQQAIQPAMFIHTRLTTSYRFLSFKIKPGFTGNTIAAIEKKWATLLPGSSFEYKFMDDSLRQLYKTELQLKKAAFTATVLSMIIVLLGVLGLVSLSIRKRIKEIGIRKVLGASVQSIISLFMKEFIIVIAMAALIACPIAWFIMRGWLADYVYRISITPIPFVIAIIGLGFITSLLITMQTITAGLANPVKSLRTE